MANCLFTYLDISLQHVTEEDDSWLRLSAGDESAALGVASDSYGYWIAVPDDLEETDEVSDTLFAVLRKARQLNCSAVRLDRDGEQYKGLPTFEWE